MSTTTKPKPARKSKKSEKPFDLTEAKTEAKTAVANMHARLADKLATDEDWKAHLRFMSGFRGYSFNNVLLLWAQWEQRKMWREQIRCMEAALFGGPVSPSLPDSIDQVGAASLWKGKGGFINKGEKGLSVLAPYTIPDRDKDPDPVTGKLPTKCIGFILKSRTFSIHQINGVEAPASPCALLEGEGPEGVWEALVPLAEADGWKVSVEPVDGTANGFCSFDRKQIVIESRNTPAQQVKTLAHEIGHKLLHGPTNQPEGMPTEIIEIEAESVAFTVLDMLGFDSSDYSLGYVAGWSKGNGTLVASTLERVALTASRIIGFLETGELPPSKSTTKFDFTPAEDKGDLAA